MTVIGLRVGQPIVHVDPVSLALSSALVLSVQMAQDNEIRSSALGSHRPVHIEIRSRDNYQHHVVVENAGEVISWSFFTRRKNVAFGLFYLYQHRVTGDGTRSNPGGSEELSRTRSSASMTKSVQSVNSVASTTSAGVREIIQASRQSVFSNTPPKPKQSRSQRSSVAPSPAMRLLNEDSLEHHELQRSRTLDGNSRRPAEDLIVRPGSPDPGQHNGPMSISAMNANEYLEILPIERYESFEKTICGQYVAPLAGTYVLYFDNSFSIHTSKELFLNVSVGHARMDAKEDEAFGGWLMKKKQLAIQGWARRWFELDNKGILSYFEDRFSPCRGSVDVSKCVISKVPHRLLITIDSDLVTYHLRAFSEEDFFAWSERLSRALDRTMALSSAVDLAEDPGQTAASGPGNEFTVESFNSRIDRELCNSHILMDKLRQLGDTNDDGHLKYLGPLEDTFESLNRLYSTLVEYNRHLRKTSRRLSVASVRLLSGSRIESPEEEFFDAEEIVLSDVSSDSDLDAAVAMETSRVLGDASTAPSLSGSTERLTVEEIAQHIQVLNVEPSPWRRRMPNPAPRCDISLGSILRKNIGKDWANVAMPVALNEPLSALQRLCEDLEYSELLDRAAGLSDSFERLVLMCAFAVSGYAGSVHRPQRKPFTPILGETFEYDARDRGFRFLAEKVCHRPLIVACHAEAEKWTFWQDQRLKSKGWGKSMEYTPLGTVNVRFHDNDDHFVWGKVITCVRNLITLTGTRWVENYGDAVIRNVRTGDQAKLSFKANSTGFFGNSSSPTNEVVCVVQSNDPERAPVVLRGRWDSILIREGPPVSGGPNDVVWRVNPMPVDHASYFGFTQFAITLNDLTEGLRESLPPTDSRFRPDQRLLELGRVDEAESEKVRIEQLQRQTRTTLEQRGQVWEPRWFVYNPDNPHFDEGAWLIRDPKNYWELRDAKKWPQMDPLW